ncbi:MAG: hypothetical protein E7473_04110 [Ruminococcaceae bacterium]|nr:hypothetical protein [Oscillospiraceae bacterium]
MLTRIISGAVAIVLFIAVVYFLPVECFVVMLAAISAVAAYELTGRNGIVKNGALTASACIFAAATPFVVYYSFETMHIFALLFGAMAISFAIWLFSYGKTNLVMVMTSVFAGVIVPLMLSVILRIRSVENGEYLILFPFIAAWLTDTGAYFTGVFLGRHKLCEKISPKKTIEGSAGGIVACVASLFVFSHIMNLSINPVLLAVGAVLLSAIAQIGDLSFSIIKREYNIKDYGNIMPGHGGVLDRFDSSVFTIPASYILLTIGGIL